MKLGGTEVRILFMGDVAFNDQYRQILESGGDPFAALKPVLAGYDLVVGNLECQAIGSRFNTLKVPYVHTSQAALRKGLPSLNLGLMSTANNHTHDTMAEGFAASQRVLQELGIQHLGAGFTLDEAQQPAIVELKGQRFGFLNYVHPDTHPSLPDPPEVFVNWFDMDRILADVRALRPKVDHLILLLHWGGKCDYGHLPHHEQPAQARAMLEAGADCIVGCHAHAFQSWASYGGKPVLFGLGNLCFADILCEGVWSRVRNSGKWSAMAAVSFSSAKKSTFSIIPFSATNHVLRPDRSKFIPIYLWQTIFVALRNVPMLYPLYYWFLTKVEPMFFHAQLQGTTVIGLAGRKLLRMVGLAHG